MKTQIPNKFILNSNDYWMNDEKFALKTNALIDYITELTTVIEKQQAQINNLRGGWTDVEIKAAEINKPRVKWTHVEMIKPWPQYNDTVFSLNSQLHINSHHWQNTPKQKTKLEVGMLFKTKEEAEARREAIIGLNK